MLCLKIAGWVANSVDPDETPRSAASHLGLYCLLRPICPNIYGKYGICTLFTWAIKWACLCSFLFIWSVKLNLLNFTTLSTNSADKLMIFFSFLACLNNIHGELLYYPWCQRPQMLKFSLKCLKPHYFLTSSLIWFIFGTMIHIGPKFCTVPSPPLPP